jgi:hypothetical protein
MVADEEETIKKQKQAERTAQVFFKNSYGFFINIVLSDGKLLILIVYTELPADVMLF